MDSILWAGRIVIQPGVYLRAPDVAQTLVCHAGFQVQPHRQPRLDLNFTGPKQILPLWCH